jgi:hypothetical protein
MPQEKRSTLPDATALAGKATAKTKPISTKVRQAIDAMVRGDVKTVTDAAATAGLSREHLSRELSKPHIAEFLQQRVKRSLAMASARAGAVKVELLDSDNAMVRDRASTFILGVAGIGPDNAQPAVSSGRTPGVTIIIEAADPAKQRAVDSRLMTLTGDVVDVTPQEIIRP